MSHSIHMSSIQIDTKNFELVKSKLIGQIKIESFQFIQIDTKKTNQNELFRSHVEHSN